MASFQRLDSGKWRVQVRKQGQYAAKSFATKGQAQTWARKTEIAIEDGVFGTGLDTPTLSDALDRYEREVTAQKKGARSERSRIRVLQGEGKGKENGQKEIFNWSDWPLSRFTASDIADIREYLSKTARPGNCTEISINIVRSVYPCSPRVGTRPGESGKGCAQTKAS
jgi:hypothetical protein